MNRAQRREMMRKGIDKSSALLNSYTRQQRMEALVKNGITPEDLEKAYNEGFDKGCAQSAMPIAKCSYGALVCVLHDEFHFSDEDCYRALKAFDEKIVYALSHSELAEEALDKTGIEIHLDEPFERVTRNQ